MPADNDRIDIEEPIDHQSLEDQNDAEPDPVVQPQNLSSSDFNMDVEDQHQVDHDGDQPVQSEAPAPDTNSAMLQSVSSNAVIEMDA